MFENYIVHKQQTQGIRQEYHKSHPKRKTKTTIILKHSNNRRGKRNGN